MTNAMLLYLHIPFCHRVCPYCSFYKHTPGATPIGGFIDALVVEADHRLGASAVPPRTLYVGGGTPSMLSPRHLTRLFAALRERMDFRKLDEVTLEANPATFDVDKARLWRELGVTRVSLGIQSFSPRVLESLGREHTAAQASASVAVERTSLLLHIIDISLEPDNNALANYKAINKELGFYNPQLLEKPQIVAINKIDLPHVKDQIKKDVARFKKKGIILHPFSAVTGEGVTEILNKIIERLSQA